MSWINNLFEDKYERHQRKVSEYIVSAQKEQDRDWSEQIKAAHKPQKEIGNGDDNSGREVALKVGAINFSLAKKHDRPLTFIDFVEGRNNKRNVK